jgi:hypothetical protein
MGDFIIRKIKHGFKICSDGQEFLVERADALAEGVFKLGRGEPGRAFRPGVDEIEDGFGLGQIDFIVQEGAFGEFSRFGLARASRKGGA